MFVLAGRCHSLCISIRHYRTLLVRAVGADAKLQRCYVNLRAFIASLKLAVYFQAIFSILVGFYFSLTYELIGIVVVVLIEGLRHARYATHELLPLVQRVGPFLGGMPFRARSCA